MGSWRRGAESSGDIDLLVTRDPSRDGKTHEGTSRSRTPSSSRTFADVACLPAGLVKKLWKKMKEAGIAQYELSLPKDDRSLDAKYFPSSLSYQGRCEGPG